MATVAEFGPRFLHSTGQAYKGGPNSGVFLQITADDVADLAVPGEKYSFGVVKAAQARGDFDVLAERGRRALRVHVTGGLAAGLERLGVAIRRPSPDRDPRPTTTRTEGDAGMQIGIIGLGRMGGNICRPALKHGHEVVVFDRDPKVVDAARPRRRQPGRAGPGGHDRQAGQAPRGLGDAAGGPRSPRRPSVSSAG